MFGYLHRFQIVEEGSYDELMKLKGTFFELVSAQEELLEVTQIASQSLLAQKGVGDVRAEEIIADTPKSKQFLSTSTEHANTVQSVTEIQREVSQRQRP